jgi:hypothetical protein
MNRYDIAKGKEPKPEPTPALLKFIPPKKYNAAASVHTADCITAIVKCFSESNDPDLTTSKNWKRRSILKKLVGIEHGGDGDGNLTCRVFENVKTHRFVQVTAGNYIQDIRDVASDFFDLCRNIIEKEIGETVTTRDLITSLTFENLPQIKDGYGGKEDVDFENCELLKLTEDSIRIMAGGDWQDPVEFTARFTAGQLKCDLSTVTKVDFADREEMTTQQMLKVLYGSEKPQQLTGRSLPWYDTNDLKDEKI